MTTHFQYDVIVIGAGHAGCEAAHIAARMGAKTCLITMDMNKIAQMSCNPAIGGIAKGQITREVDALGGLQGMVTDESALQFKMLNRSKGPAMWSPRAQCDRSRYIANMRRHLEATPNLYIWQDEVAQLFVEEGRVIGLETVWGIRFSATCIVLTAGTFLNGLMHIGRKMWKGGRASEPASTLLAENLKTLGLTAARMKTGTPVRIDARSVHFDDMEEDNGEGIGNFSFSTTSHTLPSMQCWQCQTNAQSHAILREGLVDSPLYNGQIESIGPRYCPSIETKIVTFPERSQHLLFLEPECAETNEMYLNGFSSSLPFDVQLRALKAIPAFRDVVLNRPGYAIEYDFYDPTELYHSLESKKISGLFLAGQVNGTTGYEEAAGQGIMAGINAALKLQGKEPLVLRRDEAYIGVLIDDLVTKGVDEPYRMFTSRAEYRILLRQDNADVRLTPYAIELAVLSPERTARFNAKQKSVLQLIDFAKQFSLKAERINPLLESKGSAVLVRGCKLYELITRPELELSDFIEVITPLNELINAFDDSLCNEVLFSSNVEIKYAGYINRERELAEKMKRLEKIKIRGHFNYNEISQLSTEARQKLTRINPETLGQASRIPGVSPSDISVLLLLSGR